MLNRRVALVLAALSTPALADDTQTTHADTLVVVTPNAPVIVQQGGPSTQGAPGSLGPITQPDQVQPNNGAPQNEDWENVNHINGTVVPVGERGAYLKKFRRVNLSTNPIGWMAGFYGVSASYAVSENVVIRGDVNVGKQFEHDDGIEVGISAPIYLKRAYSGPFIEPGLLVQSWKDSYDYAYYGDSYGSSASTTGRVLVEMLAGWHWTFDSGLNFALAAGASREINGDSGSDPHFAGYFRVGYAF